MAVIVREAGKTLANGHGATCARRSISCATTRRWRARISPAPKRSAGTDRRAQQLSLHGRGVFACISPWNFPVAIFTGQIAGALAAGNAVVAKPAEQTPITRLRRDRLLHEAGVPGDVLHLLPGVVATSARRCVKRPAHRRRLPSPARTDTGTAINRHAGRAQRDRCRSSLRQAASTP